MCLKKLETGIYVLLVEDIQYIKLAKVLKILRLSSWNSPEIIFQKSKFKKNYMVSHNYYFSKFLYPCYSK